MEESRGRVSAPRAFVIATVTMALTFGLFAATSLMPSTVDQAHAASISKKAITLTKGKTYKLKVKGAKASKVKWSSSKKSVAAVSKKGVVKAKKAGKATITGKYKKKKYKCVVKVKNKSAAKASGRVSESTVMSAVESSPNSFLNSSGNRVIRDTVYSGGAEYTFSVESARDSGYLFFCCSVDYSNGNRFVTYMFCKSGSSAPVSVYYGVNDFFSGTVEATVDKGSYTKNTSLSWSTMTGPSDRIAKMADSFDYYLGMSMTHWNDLLINETGYSLSNLGFTSF